MKVFDDIAAQCKADLEFMVAKQEAALRTRFSSLVREYKNDQCRSMRKSGAVEQYKERECLLQDIIAQMGDWQEQINAEKGVRGAKQQTIDSSVELQLSLTMGELEDDSTSEEEESSVNEALATEDSATVALGASYLRGDQHDWTPFQPRSVKKLRTTKRERERVRLVVMMDSLPDSIQSINEEDSGKYEYKAQRLKFEREQAERQRQHEADDAAKRRQHELELDHSVAKRTKSVRSACLTF
ncbi:hypothetical protein BBJ28_00025397 [Nothophytophthora sp. Chile5]|nr:hypothetical protein BBJ28_00025397 [Nothophytophthora sp. Chile5]